MPVLTRRRMMSTCAGAVGFMSVPGWAGVAARSAAAGGFRAATDGFADQVLALQPETATQLGVDTGDRAGLRAQSDDRSAAGQARFAALTDSMAARLHGIDRAALPDGDRLLWDTIDYALESAALAKPFFYASAQQGFAGRARPYVVSQAGGAISETPEFLASKHPIDTAADAEAYLARVAGMARALDDETAQITRDAARGVLPPDFIAATVLGQLAGFRATPAASQTLVNSLAARTAAKQIPGDWAARARQLCEGMVYPALDRQIAAFRAATAHAPHDAGVQRLPQGDEFYAWALRLGTTTAQTAGEIHRIGLAQNEELKARIDGLLVKQGITGGSVGERLQALNQRPDQLFADDDIGRAQLIAYLNGRLAAIRPLLPQVSHLGLKAAVTIKRVPPDIQDGAPLGYMNFPALDGSRPAIYYVNLKSTSLWPKYQLPTLTAHEGVPGHSLQGAWLAEHHAEVPLISSLLGFNAFIEGWALYAEQLVDELGLYADDPFGRIGYLQGQQFRACRLVADTGLHAMRWSREATIAFLMTETGRGRGAMTSETDRYCAWPGQACGYKTGHNAIVRLRAAAQAKLGARFDLAAFNDTLIRTGGVPLSVLPAAVDSYVRGNWRGRSGMALSIWGFTHLSR